MVTIVSDILDHESPNMTFPPSEVAAIIAVVPLLLVLITTVKGLENPASNILPSCSKNIEQNHFYQLQNAG